MDKLIKTLTLGLCVLYLLLVLLFWIEWLIQL